VGFERAKAVTVAQSDRSFRSLKGLERTGSTSRVLNFAAIAARNAERGEQPPPFFQAGVLGGALIIKHRLRASEHGVFARPRYTATKVVVPFERTDLSLGGRALFVGQPGWTKMLGSLHGEPNAHAQDVALLEALDELPSLDPFLVREQLKRRQFNMAPGYFVLSPADLERMETYVHGELAELVRLACGGDRLRAETEKLAHAILSGENDQRLESLRGALHLDDSEYGEGLFCWRGLLYYKWSLRDALPRLEEMVADLAAIRMVGPRNKAIIEQVVELKNQVVSGVTRRLSQVAQQVTEYDDAFALLRDQIDPSAFSKFLMAAPTAFRALGEDLGVLSHAASYWRYRFPKDAPLLAAPDELIDILEEYALALD
jgi:hypothetical protein